MNHLDVLKRCQWVHVSIFASLASLSSLALSANASPPGAIIANEPPASSLASSMPAAFTFRSNVIGASFVRFAELPTVTPYGDDPNEYCGKVFHAATPQGRMAERHGWRVVQETRYHGFNAVLIVRGYDQGTSSHCFAKDPNLAFFDGEHLVAVLYSKGEKGIGMNAVESIGDHLRIWDDLSAVGQISVKGENFTFDRVSGDDEVCGGKYRVPAVFGLPYSKARTILGKVGWLPKRSSEKTFGSGDRTLDYRSRFPEADSCSPTGYGYCAFALHAQSGVATLEITTAGENEDPGVVSYGVSCGGRLRH